MHRPWARFDGLRTGGALRCLPPRRVLTAVRLDGRWWTPPTASGCLPGVERGRLLDLGVLHERVLHPADLLRAEDLAVCSSLRGWRPATLVVHHPPGPALHPAR